MNDNGGLSYTQPGHHQSSYCLTCNGMFILMWLYNNKYLNRTTNFRIQKDGYHKLMVGIYRVGMRGFWYIILTFLHISQTEDMFLQLQYQFYSDFVCFRLSDWLYFGVWYVGPHFGTAIVVSLIQLMCVDSFYSYLYKYLINIIVYFILPLECL